MSSVSNVFVLTHSISERLLAVSDTIESNGLMEVRDASRYASCLLEEKESSSMVLVLTDY